MMAHNELRKMEAERDTTSNALKTLKTVHQIIGEYLNGAKTGATRESTDSILAKVKRLLASAGIQDGIVTPPDSDVTLPVTMASNKSSISPLTLQPREAVAPSEPIEKLLGGARPPQEVIMGLFAQMSAVSAINLFKHWGAFDAIPVPATKDGPGSEPEANGISFADLAKKVNVEKALLSKSTSLETPCASPRLNEADDDFTSAHLQDAHFNRNPGRVPGWPISHPYVPLSGLESPNVGHVFASAYKHHVCIRFTASLLRHIRPS